MGKNFLDIKKIYIQTEKQKKDLINNLIRKLDSSKFIEIEFIRIKVLVYFLNYEKDYKNFINKKYLKSQTIIEIKYDEIYKLFNNLLDYILRYKFYYASNNKGTIPETLISENPNFTKEFYSSFYNIEKFYYNYKRKKRAYEKLIFEVTSPKEGESSIRRYQMNESKESSIEKSKIPPFITKEYNNINLFFIGGYPNYFIN